MMKSLVVFTAMRGILATQSAAQKNEVFPGYDQMGKAELQRILVLFQKDLLVLEVSHQELGDALREAKKAHEEAAVEDTLPALLLVLDAASENHMLGALDREFQRARRAYSWQLDRERLRTIASNYPSTVNAQEPTPKPTRSGNTESGRSLASPLATREV